MQIKGLQRAPGSVDTPPAGYTSLFNDSTANGLPSWKDVNGGTHPLATGVAAITAAVTASTTAETQVVGATIPANAMQVGTTFRIRAIGQVTVTTAGGTITFRLRIGTATIMGALIQSIANTTVLGTAIGFSLEILATVRTIGAAGTVVAMMFQTNSAATGLTATANVAGPANGTAPVAAAIATNVANVFELTAQASATTSTPTFYVAEIEIVKP